MTIEAVVHLLHIIIIGGLFIYVGIMRQGISPYLFPFLLSLGIVIVFYHIFKAYKYSTLGKPIWVNLIHILLVGPLLIYIGYSAADTARLYFEMLLMLGFSAIGYHGYYLFQN